MERRTRRDYLPEYKREAVALASQPEQTVVGVAAGLGLCVRPIRRLKREFLQHGQQAFLGPGVARDEASLALRRQFSQVKKERDFSISASAFFAKDGK